VNELCIYQNARCKSKKILNSSWNTEKLSDARNETIIVPIYNKGLRNKL